MNIDYLPPELQEEMRRVFADELEGTSENEVQDSTSEDNNTPIIEDVDFEEIENDIEVDVESTIAQLLGEPIEDIPTITTTSISEDILYTVLDQEEETENLEIVNSEEVENIEETNDSTEEDNNTSSSGIDMEELEEVINNWKKQKELQAQYTRFRGADWFDIVQQQEVVLAGLGGIGSYVNLFLSRLNPKTVYLFDADSFESHNMSGQLVSRRGIGISKTSFARDIAMDFSNYNPFSYFEMYTSNSLTAPVMICGFDNMEARKIFYHNWKKAIDPSSPGTYLFMDGRLLAEEFQIICITGDDVYSQQLYEEEYLFEDSAVEEVSCTLKQTSHIAGMIGSQMVTYFVNFCNNLSNENFPRRFPFFTHYNSIVNTYEYKY